MQLKDTKAAIYNKKLYIHEESNSTHTIMLYKCNNRYVVRSLANDEDDSYQEFMALKEAKVNFNQLKRYFGVK